MKTATAEAPTEVASPEPKPAVAMTPKTSTTTTVADSQDVGAVARPSNKSRDPEKARAVLRGEISAADDQGRDGKRGADGDGESDNESRTEDDAEVIARMFDPETGEFIEEDGDDESESPTMTRSSRKAPESRRSGKDSPASSSSERDMEVSAHAEAQAEAEKEEEQEKEKAQGNEDDAEDRKPGPKKRISVTRGRLGDRDFAIVQLADRENISLEEARGRLFGNSTPEAAAAQSAEAAANSAEAREGTSPAPTRESPEAIQARIDGLLEQRKAANKALDVEKATELTDQIADLKLLQRDAWQDLQSEAQSRAASHRDAVIASANQAVGLYPDAGVEGKELFEAIDAERIERERTDPEFFRNPRWPITLAVEVATDLGIAPQAKSSGSASTTANANANAAAATAAAAAAGRQAPALPPKKAARPAPPNPAPGTATGAAQINQEDALRTELKAAKTSKDATAIKAVMRKIDAFHARKR